MNKAERAIYEKNRRLKLKNWFREEFLPTQKCSKCNENHPGCLDFHHKDSSTKESGIARMLHDTKSKSTLLKEIAKCEVLCANCHRKHHYEEMLNGDIELGYNQKI